MAVWLCISHKIADGCRLCNFVSAWASLARQSGEKMSPIFITIPNVPFALPNMEFGRDNCITKRFVFHASKIARLRATAIESGILSHNPTRVELVTALLYKCVVVASGANKASFKKSILIQLVNMRSRMDPPLPQNFVGNFTWYFTVSNHGKLINMNKIIDQLRNTKLELCDKGRNNLTLKDWLLAKAETMDEEVKRLIVDVDTINKFISHCNFPYYGVDFGLGKPLWVSMANGVAKNSVVLMDANNGVGIEAILNLEEEDMNILERDEELLHFASLNPFA